MNFHGALVGSLVILTVLAVSDAWVYRDAQRRQEERNPVVAHVGSISFDSPQTWLLGCVALWILVFPLYLRAREAVQ